MTDAPTPAAIAALIKQRAKAKVAAVVAMAKADEKKAACSAIEEQLLAALQEAKLDTAGAGGERVFIVKSREPQVEDWPKLYAYIKKHNAFELLHKRVTAPAWRERSETKPLPGVVDFINVKLSFRSV